MVFLNAFLTCAYECVLSESREVLFLSFRFNVNVESLVFKAQYAFASVNFFFSLLVWLYSKGVG